MSRSTPRGAPRILIVDDRPDVRRLVGLMLEVRGYSIVGEAQDGQEAVDLIQEGEPDLVILDLEMPRMGGMSALARIKQAAPTVKVVMFVSSDTGQQRAQALAAGADGWVDKVDAMTLPEVVDRILS